MGIRVTEIRIIEWFDAVVTGIVLEAGMTPWLACLIALDEVASRKLYVLAPMSGPTLAKINALVTEKVSKANYQALVDAMAEVARTADPQALLQTEDAITIGAEISTEPVRDQRVLSEFRKGDFKYENTLADENRRALLQRAKEVDMTPMEPASITVNIAGIGIIFYSPSFAAAIQEGENYFERNYKKPEDVQRHIQSGTIVGFGTGTSGTFILSFFTGYPSNDEVSKSKFALRLGVRVEDGVLCFRDLYDLVGWAAACPAEQKLTIPNGIYHITLLSDVPASGVLGDYQAIKVYFQPLPTFPALAKVGIPTLCK